MTERRWSIRFSDGQYGPLLSRLPAEHWFDAIDPERKLLCELTCWERVTDATAVTERPPPSEVDPFSEAAIRAAMPTLKGSDE